MSYDEIKNEIKAAPKTWLPGLLVCVVKTSLEKKVFKPGGAARVAKEVEDEALGLPEDVAGGSYQRMVGRSRTSGGIRDHSEGTFGNK